MPVHAPVPSVSVSSTAHSLLCPLCPAVALNIGWLSGAIPTEVRSKGVNNAVPGELLR